MTSLNVPQSLVYGNWVGKRDAAEILGVSTYTLKLYRKKHWTENIHFLYLNSRTIRYNESLLRDWIANLSCPSAHLRAIELFSSSLLSNQPKKRGRKS